METRKAGPLRFDIGGMHCAACSSRIERVVGRMENVERIAVNLATAKAQIWLKPGTESETVPLIMERVAGMGFSAVPSQEEDVAVQYEKKRRQDEKDRRVRLGRLGPMLVFAVPLLILSMGHMLGMPLPAWLDPHHAPRTFMLAQLALADPLARFALHDSRAELGLCTLAPSLPFIAAAGALRGCFLARRRVEPNIIAQLVEQTVRMAVAALALVKLVHWGAAYACCAVLIGNTVSEAVSCGIMALFARQEPSFRPCADDPPRGYTSRELWEIVLPVTGSRLVASVLQAGESVLIPACLAAYLGTRAEAVAQYGSLKGMALPLIFFPFSVLAALSGLLMPEITRAHTARDTAALRRLVRLAMGLTGGFSLLVGAALVLFGKDAAILLYHDAQAGRYVQVLGFVAPFMYLESMVDAILKGMGEQLATFRYSVLDSILRIAGILWLMPQYGMPGFLAVMTASNLLTCGLNTGRMVRQLRREEVGTEREIRN